MSKQILLILVAVTVIPLLSACMTDSISIDDGVKSHSESNIQFIQLTDEWYSFNLPSVFHGGYEPAHRLTMFGKLHQPIGDRLELQAPVELQSKIWDSRLDSLVMANITRPRENICHQDQLALSETWNRVSSGVAGVDNGRLRVDSPPNDCYYELPDERVRAVGQGDNVEVRQYIGNLGDGRFVYMVCSEGDSPDGFAKCEVETTWRSANLFISFATRHNTEWKNVIGLVDGKFNAAHVAISPIGDVGADDLDVKLMFNDVSFQFPAEFVYEVAERLPRGGAEDWWIRLDVSYSKLDKKVSAIKAHHETGYRRLPFSSQNLTISINTPRFKNKSVGELVFADTTDWSAVIDDFKSVTVDLKKKKRSSLGARDAISFEYHIRVSGMQIGQMVCKSPQMSNKKIKGNCSHFMKRDGIAIKIDTQFSKEVDLSSLYQAIEERLSGFSKI